MFMQMMKILCCKSLLSTQIPSQRNYLLWYERFIFSLFYEYDSYSDQELSLYEQITYLEFHLYLIYFFNKTNLDVGVT